MGVEPFLRELPDGEWEVLLAGRGRIREGETLRLPDPVGGDAARIELVRQAEGGRWQVRPAEGGEALEILGRVGRPPLPPYIRREGRDDSRAAADREDYQTVYARADGAVAAPTAGLHFTPEVLAALEARGIERVSLTLYVGLGTFQPIRCERLADHEMHAERVAVPAPAAERIEAVRARGGRVVAVGTTTVRALESAADASGAVRPWSGETDLFIYPPYEFRAVGSLLTNFHLPRTTLLAMVCALAGTARVLAAYEGAKREGYRFYSYGDAMLIL
jgi:S-adenosylmethionine:tRNA ribosyltransferase-isomerase